MSETPPEDPNVKVLTRRFGRKLCDYCNELLLAIESLAQKRGISTRIVQYHLTQSSLKNALQSGCQFCAILTNFNASDIDTDFPSEIVLEQNLYIVFVFVKRDTCFPGLTHPARVLAGPEWYFSRPERYTKNLASARISQDLHSTPGDATDSQSAWGLCRLWLDNCVNNHQRCKNLRAGTWWPTRFLYIGDRIDGDGDLSRLSIKLCLREDEQPQGSYMTLSHCWGDPKKMLRLTNSNLRHFKDVGIPYTDLPRTFQDFVRLCRFLQSDYVWVDSLCIIQDSDEDWIHESSTMADIYQCSKCNIAATSSKNPTEGCFHPRNVNLVTPMEFTILKGAGDNLSEEKYLVVGRHTWENNVEAGPLNKRCWVIQERILSPRKIHCGRQQLLWECHENFACETFPFTFNFGQEFGAASAAVSLTELIPTLSEMNKMRLSEMKNNWRPDCHLDDSEITTNATLKVSSEVRFSEMRRTIYRYWINIVEKYSECGLSYRTDKLIAISGIASRIQGVLEGVDDYVVGLWKSQLPEQLLWRKGKHHKSSNSKNTYDIAPSWSWASFDGPVRFSRSDEDRYTIAINILNVYDGHSIAKHGTATNMKESPLELQCLLHKVIERKYILLRPDKHGNVNSMGQKVSISFEDGDIDYDFLEQAYLIPVLWCPSIWCPLIWNGDWWCLLVTPCPGRPGFYRRFGCHIIYSDPVSRTGLEYAPMVPDEDKVTITLI